MACMYAIKLSILGVIFGESFVRRFKSVQVCLFIFFLYKLLILGDIVLVGLRGYQDDKADVILKYTPEEARLLKNDGSLPESATLNEGGEDHDVGDGNYSNTNCLLYIINFS